VQADPDVELLCLIDVRVAIPQRALERDGTGDRLKRARELDEEAVAGPFDLASAVRGDALLNHAVVLVDQPEAERLVALHHPRVPDHVGQHQSCEV